MNHQPTRFYLFGGNHMQRLSSELSRSGEIAGKLLGISPLSDVDCAFGGGELASWTKKLDEQLEQAAADYIVLDLHTAAMQMFYVAGHYLTATPANEKLLLRDSIALIDPTQMEQTWVRDALDRLIDTLRTHFNRRQIILVHTHLPEFYWIGKAPRMRDGFAAFAKNQKWYDELEAYFADKTQCHVVDIARFYFHKKEEGRPLTDLIYEEYCYQDMAEQISRICCGESGKTARPNFRYSMQRYIDGRFTLYLRGFSTFLNKDYLLDHLILSSTREFVKNNYEGLAMLDALDWSDPKAALEAMPTCGAPQNIQTIMYAFAKVVQGEYRDPNADYASLFRNHIAPVGLLTVLQDDVAAKGEVLPIQVNTENAGYYFAKMLGLPTEAYMTERTVVKPTVVDVYGSCISRTAFNVLEHDCAVNRYWFQIPPFQNYNERVDYPAGMFPERPHWADRLVKDQFDGTVYRQIEESVAEWLVIDLFAFVTVIQYKYNNCYYTDYNRRISKQLGAQSVSIHRDPTVMGDWDEIMDKMSDWFGVIKKKYGEKIILINGQRRNHWIGDDDVIYKLKNPDQTMAYTDKVFKTVGERLGCYCIDTYKPFLPDDCGYISNTPAHKEDECYLYAHAVIRKIMQELPEQKLYNRYPGQIQIRRLARLMGKNSPKLLDEALMLDELDRAVVRLDRKLLLKYENELARIYDTCEHTLRDVTKKNASEYPAELIDALKAAGSGKGKDDDATDFPCAYEDYSADSGVIGVKSQLFQSPLLRRVELRELVNDRSNVRLQCVSAAGTPVLVFRKTATSDWKLVKRGAAGNLYDSDVKPLTEYWYMVCTEGEKDGKHYLGQFTKPQMIRTGVATPEIAQVLTLDGMNHVTWDAVEGAEGYYIYHKVNEEDAWQRCACVSGSQTRWSEPAENSGWYTLRAFSGTGAAQVVSGHRAGTQAQSL